jgi:hypothetical protein
MFTYLVHSLESSDITNLYYNETQIIIISSTKELYEVPFNNKRMLKPLYTFMGLRGV